jgi:hypothetical protein
LSSVQDLIREASELPVEERALLVDSLLRTLNAPDPDIDRAWAEVAKQRLAGIRSGRVTPVPGDEVLSKLQERFKK